MATDIILGDDDVRIVDGTLFVEDGSIVGSKNLSVGDNNTGKLEFRENGNLRIQDVVNNRITTGLSYANGELSVLREMRSSEMSADLVRTTSVEAGGINPGEGADPGRIVVKDNRGRDRVIIDERGVREVSDARCKENVEPIEGALRKVAQLRGVSFEWRDGDCEGAQTGEGRQLGLIAQEAQAVLPEVVTENENGFFHLSYNGVVPVLVEALKEQQSLIAEQRVALEALEENRASLERRLARLEAKLEGQRLPADALV